MLAWDVVALLSLLAMGWAWFQVLFHMLTRGGGANFWFPTGTLYVGNIAGMMAFAFAYGYLRYFIATRHRREAARLLAAFQTDCSGDKRITSQPGVTSPIPHDFLLWLLIQATRRMQAHTGAPKRRERL